MAIFAIRQWHVAFPLMCVGLYVAETPNSRCLFGKTTWFNKTPVYYHNVAHLAAVGHLIFSRANKQQGNSADFKKEIVLRYACFVSKPYPLAKTIA